MRFTTNTNNYLLSAKSNFLRFGIITSLFVGAMLMSNELSAQIVLEYEDIVMFSGPSTSPSHGSYSQIGKTSEPNIQISPNPISNQATLTKDQGISISRLEVLDTQGNMLFSSNQSNGSVVIPQLNAGYYYFKVYTNQGVASKIVSIN